MPSLLPDPEQTRNRLEILNQFFRGMLLLNGGACIALLAFLQAIWTGLLLGSYVACLVGWCFLYSVWRAPLQASTYDMKLQNLFSLGCRTEGVCRLPTFAL
jgi:hypothetical protein